MATFVNDGGYNIQYLKNLRTKLASETRIGMNRIIDSMGTLGGGNHFIEIGESQETGDYWVIIHSGSRKLGLAVAQYHQQQAINRRAEKEINEGLDSLDVPERYIDSVGSKGVQPDVDVIRDELDGEEIEETIQEIHGIGIPDDFNENLAHLEGKDAEAYLIDMIFAQQYALESRRQMAEAVRSVVDGEKKDTITSVHNFIDFRDLVIRKGATSAHEGERLIIPFNMRDGTIIARGLGNGEFNFSAPHGAGRLGSRRWAHESFSGEEVQESMADVFSTGIPTDEAPMAYKPMELIEKHIEPTAEIVDRIVPVMNLKSLD
jgi:RNA-splicing ligase RtcB